MATGPSPEPVEEESWGEGAERPLEQSPEEAGQRGEGGREQRGVRPRVGAEEKK